MGTFSGIIAVVKATREWETKSPGAVGGPSWVSRDARVTLPVSSLLIRQRGQFSAPSCLHSQILQTMAPLYPSLPTCGLYSHPRLLPWGMSMKADSAIFL